MRGRRVASRRGLEGKKKKKEKGRRSSSSNFFPPFDIVSLYLVRLPYFYFSPYREQPVLDIFLRRVLARTSYLSMWKQPRGETRKVEGEKEAGKNIKRRRMENGSGPAGSRGERPGSVGDGETKVGKKNREYREKQEGTSLLERPKHLRAVRSRE